jgi:hypothetical protein
MTWRAEGETGLAFEDLSERGALKLHSTLRYTGRFHYALWEREVTGEDFFERTDQFTPIYSMELEVTDAPLNLREPLIVETTIRLGRTVDASGETTRIVGRAQQTLRGTAAEGGAVEVGTLRKHSVFTRPDGPREQRGVRELHESLGLGPRPPRTFRLLTTLDLSVPPADFDPDPVKKTLSLADAGPHVWGYEQTDPNRHVHAMDYVKVMEGFGWDHLARGGIAAAGHFYDSCRILFRAPCFRGEGYLRTGRFEPRDERQGGGGLLIGEIHKVNEEGKPRDPSRPAVAIQLGVRPNAHPASGPRDSE